MTQPLYWLTLTAFATVLMWIPYVLNLIMVRGLMAAMSYPGPDAAPLAPWADRCKKAHANAIENLPIFATLVIVAHLVGVEAEAVTTAAMIFFFARMVHYLVYTFKVPVVRTLSFFVSFGALVAIALQIFGKVG